MKKANDVDEYIAKCPTEAQDKLRRIRTAIREVAPDATERTDYFQIPGYSYEGMIMMECLLGSASRNQTCVYTYVLQ